MLKSLQEKFSKFAGSFYDWGSLWAHKLSRLCGLTQFLSWLGRCLSKSPMLIGIESFVAISLVVYYFFLMFPQAQAPRQNDGNEWNAYLFTFLSDHPYSPHKDLYSEIDAWKARLPGPLISGWVYDSGLKIWAKVTGGNVVRPRQMIFGNYRFDVPTVLFSFYHSIWLLLLFLILVLHRKDALLIMVGTFSGLMYNFIMPSGQWFFPWDLPAMFFFTWAWLVYDKRSFFGLFVVVWLGSLFKETILCCALLVLLGEHWQLKKRIAGFLAIVTVSLLTRKLFMSMYGVNTMIFAGNEAENIHDFFSKAWSCFVYSNLKDLFSLDLDHVLFINAGTLFIMMMIPWRNRRDVVLKILVIAFIIGQCFFGDFTEFRIWYEVLPLGWMLISEAVLNRYQLAQETQIKKRISQSNPTVDGQTFRVMQGSYWLMIGALFGTAFIIWLVTNRL